MSDSNKNNKKILIGNLPAKTSVEELTDLFSSHTNSLVAVSLKFDLKGNNAGHAFIEMTSREDALDIVEQLNGVELQGRILNISMAEQPQDNQAEKKRKKFIFF